MTTGAKTCTKCERNKPLEEFPHHARTRDGRDSWCRDCNNRGRKPTSARYIRNRARQRATAELIKLHEEEFHQLLERHTEYVADELEMLRGAAASQRDHDLDAPRLKPGPVRKGQDVVDRLDVARCEHCRAAHDAGHACRVCGALRAECGTEKGYQKHHYLGEVACEPCLDAHADNERNRKARADHGADEPRWVRGPGGVWKAISPDDIDEAAILRRMDGDTDVPLTHLERVELVNRCRAKGWSYTDIEERAGVPKAEGYIDRGAAS